MFYGEYEHTIDRKGRLIIPSKFRQALKAYETPTLFVTRGLDGCLFVFPESEWQQVESRFRQIPFTKGEGRKFNRLFFSGASSINVDGLGRILIPKTLKTYAQIKADVVIVGVSNRIEIWSKEQWREFYEKTQDSFEAMAERIITE